MYDEYYVCDWSGGDYHHSVHTFWKRNQKQMQPVLDAIGQIKDQNLEYETSCSGIKEFDDCLSAIDDMRDALRESLEKQWKTEQEKKQQMSALAHDIKTPLTIVRGNAELLSETRRPQNRRKISLMF